MAWSFDNLRYGWKIATGIALAGVTIYTISNTRWRINQVDEIEIALGVYERCLATQTATNPTYAVTPPDFVRSWYSNSYETQVVAGVTGVVAVLHTNIFTNAIGFRTDRAMLVDLDAKIFALIPYYVDTNTVYDGTTNISMLTVTGLFASLQIGDHTNQFTAVPCWTNNVGQTNCTTNVATFGPWAGRNYVVAWQERYKVLNALKMRNLGDYAGTSFPGIVGTATLSGHAIDEGYTTGTVWYSSSNLGIADGTDYGFVPGSQYEFWGDNKVSFGRDQGYWQRFRFSFQTSCQGWGLPNHPPARQYDAHLKLDADPEFITLFYCIPSHGPDRVVTDIIVNLNPFEVEVSALLTPHSEGGSWAISFYLYGVINFPFNYCTNKYW